jgi:hypothetical protein
MRGNILDSSVQISLSRRPAAAAAGSLFVMCTVTVARCGSLMCAWFAVISSSACVSPVGHIDIRNCPITFDSCSSFSNRKNQPRALQMVMTPVSMFGSVSWILAFDKRKL